MVSGVGGKGGQGERIKSKYITYRYKNSMAADIKYIWYMLKLLESEKHWKHSSNFVEDLCSLQFVSLI